MTLFVVFLFFIAKINGEKSCGTFTKNNQGTSQIIKPNSADSDDIERVILRS